MTAKENTCVNDTDSIESFVAEKYEKDVKRVANSVCKSIRRGFKVDLDAEDICHEVWLALHEVANEHQGLDCERCIRLALHAARKRLTDQHAKYIIRNKQVDFQSRDEPQDAGDFAIQRQIYDVDDLHLAKDNAENDLIDEIDQQRMHDYLLDNGFVTEQDLTIKMLYDVHGNSLREIGFMFDISKDKVKDILNYVNTEIDLYLMR